MADQPGQAEAEARGQDNPVCYYCGRSIRGKVYYLKDSVYPFFSEVCRKCREEFEDE